MLDAAAPRGVDRHEIIAGTVFVGWFATLTLVNSFVKSDPRAVQQALLINPEVYKFPAVAFATAMFLGLIDSLSGLAGNKSKQLAIIPFVQNMVACTAFLSFAYPDSFLGSPVILDGFGRLLRKEKFTCADFKPPTRTYFGCIPGSPGFCPPGITAWCRAGLDLCGKQEETERDGQPPQPRSAPAAC